MAQVDARAGDAPAIEFDHVWFSYPPGGMRETPRSVLEDVTLRVALGQRLGIVGPNGGGKTTLLRLSVGLLEPTRGRVRVLGRGPAEACRAGLVGFVAQRSDAELAFPLSARQAVELGAWRSLSREARDRSARALDLVGATDWAERPVGKLSGGQLQRVLIARAIAAGARILLLDEPTVGVDVVGQELFSKLLDHVHQELGLTIVIVSHDLRAIAAGCDAIACLSERHIHTHTSPDGLTPQVLAEVFEHDVAARFGDVHVHAHAAEECPEPYHGHDHGRASGAPDEGAPSDPRGEADDAHA